jgi:hypothetical protein
MYSAIYATSQVLAKYLTARLQAVNGLGFGAARIVSINSPYELREEVKKEGLSIWLYRVERDDMRLNRPDERLAENLLRRPPLPLRLHYLMTPVTFSSAAGGSPDVNQKVLGCVLQALHTHPILRGIDLKDTDLEGTDTELHPRLETLTLDELSRVWEALEGSFQLAMSYEVSVVNIDVSSEPLRIAPVEIALPAYGAIVGEA